MSEEEKKIICEWIGYEYIEPNKKPRPKVNEEWRRKWEQWNKDQHEAIGRTLNDA